MRDALTDGRRWLLADNVAENSAISAHYLQMVPQYADLNNREGMRYSLKCAVACIKAAVRSFNELEALDGPQDQREAAE